MLWSIWGFQAMTKETFGTRFWKPTRAVVHAAAAFLTWQKTICGELDPSSRLNDPMLACLFFPNLLKKIILTSEIYRRQLASITQFKINEEETVAFYY